MRVSASASLAAGQYLIVGDYGRVKTTRDSGASWEAAASGTGLQRSAVVSMQDGNRLVVLGQGLSTAVSSDAGRHWVRRPTGDVPGLISIATLPGSGDLVAVGSAGAIARSSDGGATWSSVDSPTGQDLWSLIALPDGQTVLAVGAEGTVIRSLDGGRTWAVMPSGVPWNLLSIAASADGTTLVAVGWAGTVLVSRDLGDTWTARPTFWVEPFYGVAAVPGGTSLVAVSTQGLLSVSTDDGATWDNRYVGQLGLLFTVAALSDGHTLLVGGVNGLLLRSEDGGTTWTRKATQSNATVRQFLMLPRSKSIVALTDGADVLQSNDNGQSWTRQDYLSDFGSASTATVGSDDTIVGVTSGQTVIRSGDRGKTWTEQTAIGPSILNAIRASSGGQVLTAVGEYGVILRSSDGGAGWVRQSSPTRQALTSLVSLKGGQTFIATIRGSGTVKSSDGGLTWQLRGADGDLRLGQLVALADGTLLGVEDDGWLVRSEDAGESWTKVSKPGDTRMRWLQALPGAPTTLGIDAAGRVARSEDRGTNWTVVPGGDRPPMSSMAASSDGQTLLALDINQRDIEISRDRGASWARAYTSPLDLSRVAFLDGGHVMMAVGVRGFLVRSDDGGTTWLPQLNRDPGRIEDIAEGSVSLFAVGLGVTSQHPNPIRGVAADQMRLTASGDLLRVAWRYPPGAVPHCDAVLWRRFNGSGSDYATTGTALRSLAVENGRGGYEAEWSPGERIGAANGSEFSYALQCSDDALGVSWRQVLPGNQVYNPSLAWSARLWEWLADQTLIGKLEIAVASTLGLWFGALLLLLVVKPAWLVDLHEALAETAMLNDVVEAADKSFSNGLARLLLSLPAASAGWFGRSPRAIDHWLVPRMAEVVERFAHASSPAGRGVTVDLPIRIGGYTTDQPWAAIDALFGRNSVPVLISGPGGAGKTTLACRIGERLATGDPARPGMWPCVPLLIERDLEPSQIGEKLPRFLLGKLRIMLGITRLSIGMVRTMLETGRVVVIVDGLSERGKDTRDAFSPANIDIPIKRLIVTSRGEHPDIYQKIHLEGIAPADLFTFLKSYNEALAKRNGVLQLPTDQLYDACAGLSRVLKQAPVTPLLATLWSEQLVRGDPQATASIRNVAGLMDACIDAMLGTVVHNPDAVAASRADLESIAFCELGTALTPRFITRGDVLAALRAVSETYVEDRLTRLLASRLMEVELQSDLPPEQRYVHVALDPVAEHLVAQRRLGTAGSDEAAWNSLVQEIEAARTPAGFLDAMLACLEDNARWRVPPNIAETLKTMNGRVEAPSAETIA